MWCTRPRVYSMSRQCRRNRWHCWTCNQNCVYNQIKTSNSCTDWRHNLDTIYNQIKTNNSCTGWRHVYICILRVSLNIDNNFLHVCNFILKIFKKDNIECCSVKLSHWRNRLALILTIIIRIKNWRYTMCIKNTYSSNSSIIFLRWN